MHAVEDDGDAAEADDRSAETSDSMCLSISQPPAACEC